MIWAHSIALLLDVAGLTCAAAGFAQTWHQHGTGELWAPWRARARDGRRRAWSWVTGRLRRRRHDPWLGDGGGGAGGSAIARGGATAPGADARAAVTDLAAFAAVVQSRLDGLTGQVGRLETELRTERQRRDSAVRGVRAELIGEVGRVEELTKEIAVGGLRLQILGWTLVLAGVVLSGVLNIVGAATR
ncbi:hypothetical protein [Jiangella endophytica]|uniref:hypothetical protein n=1 Tax=Jiangella endophytica TaxID=1623398 RepID=UPI000E355ED6|nr:hypothetical protein [Jiangella endophytica]